MSKKKLREWEIPMNLSDEEKKEYGMTINDKLNNTAKPKQRGSEECVEKCLKRKVDHEFDYTVIQLNTFKN